MRTYRTARAAVAAAVGIWVVSFLVGPAMAAQDQATPEAGVQVLTRGPVHEAFAEASMTGAMAGVVITTPPPDPIAELPPDQRPEGASVAWIPGYWSWDDDRSAYIWVSGVWRDLPPGRQWVPGYWTLVAGGSQWISGFWGDAAQTEVTYLPPPPEPREAGPSSPAPAPGNLWTPGCWIWQQSSYAWQPGYWVVQQPDWVWVPAHYTWTPRGYVYVQGYWDHDIVHRGVMFAPVYYNQPIYTRPDYSYSPSTVIDLAVMAACLFVHPRSNRYFYGDYYDPRYEQRGFYPWYSKRLARYGEDPIYAHYRSRQLRRDPDWDVHIDDQFRYRREHVDARPPQTLALQVNIINNRGAGVPENVIIGRSFAEAAQSKTVPLRFTSVNADEHKEIVTRGREVRKLGLERARVETAPAAGRSETDRKDARPVKFQLPVSPVVGRPMHTTETGGVPPTPTTPKPTSTEGKSRREKPRKIRAEADPPKTLEKPAKAASRPSQTRERPKRVEVKPEALAPESASRVTAPKPRPPRRERAPAKTESASQTPQPGGTATQHNVQAGTEARLPKTHEAQRAPKSVEPKREPPKPEVKSRKAERHTQPSHKDARKQRGKRGQAPSTEDNKEGQAK